MCKLIPIDFFSSNLLTSINNKGDMDKYHGQIPYFAIGV
jgi:hypothetical protein